MYLATLCQFAKMPHHLDAVDLNPTRVSRSSEPFLFFSRCCVGHRCTSLARTVSPRCGLNSSLPHSLDSFGNRALLRSVLLGRSTPALSPSTASGGAFRPILGGSFLFHR